MSSLRIALLSFFLLASAQLSEAADQFGAFVLPDEAKDAIILNGEIGIGAPLDFRRALSARPGATVLVLSSPGGLVASGLILAQDVHDRGLSTFIPEGLGCYSACSFVFFAGNSREADGELGVHQMTSDTPDPSGVQYSTADILDVLRTFDVSEEVVSRMLRTPNSSMYVFSKSELNDFGINRLAPTAEATKPSALPTPKPQAAPQSNGQTQLALYEGLDFYGGDIESSRLPDAVQCATSCMQDAMCRAFTFNANPSLKRGPNCFLKDSTARPDSYKDAVSGLIIRDGSSAPSFSVNSIDTSRDVSSGIDYPGGDIQQSPWPGIRTASQCSEICNGLSACVGFSFSSAQRQCWPKSTLGPPRRARSIISGVKGSVVYAAKTVINID
jgi:hypothetical protein